MKKSLLRWTVVAALLAALSGCLSPSDKWLTQNLSPSEKAGLITARGQSLYETLLEKDDLSLIPSVRSVYATALLADPGNEKTLEAQKTLDTWVTKRQTDAKGKAASLTAKKPELLTEKEKYDLVVVFRQLKVLAPPDFNLVELETKVAPLEAEVIAYSTKRILTYEQSLAVAKSEASIAVILSSIKNSIAALVLIDPKNPEAAAAEKRLSLSIEEHLSSNLADAKKALTAKSYSDAVKALAVVDKTLTSVGAEPPEDVQKLRYQVYFDWAKSLFDSKKFSEATSRINSALAVKSTEEALDLKVKIGRSASARDFDAEYAAIDKQIEGLIKSGDFDAAWSMIGTTLPQLKKDDTKAQATSRRKQILDGVHDLYDSAVKSYNEEDYAEAKLGLDIVVAVDPGYLLAKSYYEKAKSKIQALGGR